MHITLLLIVTYIVCCLRVGTAPWKYFQLNARYFSNDQGIFSKLSIDKLIPERWRLQQFPDDGEHQPERYPVFLKPEWGQNAQGIHRADNLTDLTRLRKITAQQEQAYILQEAACGLREYEIFSIDSKSDDGIHDVMTVTEAVNTTESFPINSKYNTNTRYVDISEQFSAAELHLLSSFVEEIGKFKISRLSVRANSRQELLAGNFHVIEINLFLPMPINLLDNSYSWETRLKFIYRAMTSLAKATKEQVPVDNPRAIFTRMMLYGKKNPLPQFAKLFDTRRSIL